MTFLDVVCALTTEIQLVIIFGEKPSEAEKFALARLATASGRLGKIPGIMECSGIDTGMARYQRDPFRNHSRQAWR
jgi:hypothetical protein